MFLSVHASCFVCDLSMLCMYTHERAVRVHPYCVYIRECTIAYLSNCILTLACVAYIRPEGGHTGHTGGGGAVITHQLLYRGMLRVTVGLALRLCWCCCWGGGDILGPCVRLELR